MAVPSGVSVDMRVIHPVPSWLRGPAASFLGKMEVLGTFIQHLLLDVLISNVLVPCFRASPRLPTKRSRTP